MAGGSWDPTALPIRPGLYINFKEAAAAQITGGARGTVAMPLMTYTGATEKKFFTIENEKQASDNFGAANIQPIKWALQGGAKEVLVYTMPTTPAAQDYIDMRAAFEARPFNVFVFDGEASDTEQDNTLTWCDRNKDEGKHFMVVFGGNSADDADPALGNANTTRLAHEYAVNLISGVTINDTDYSSGQYAPYIAGLIAGKRINESITYAQVPVADVTRRMTNSEIKTALQAGSLVLVHDGEKVKIEQGLTTSVDKIRAIRARQAVATDVTKTASDAYIGKISNNRDGQAALLSAIKAYLETLEVNGVLTDLYVGLDPQYDSVGDKVYVLISYREIDSMERILININL